MRKYRKLTHTVYKYDYHIVWTPKYRYRILKGEVSSLMSHDLYALSSMKDIQIEELNIQEDHVNLLCSILPKLSVSSFMGYLKGKTAISFSEVILNSENTHIKVTTFGQEDTSLVQLDLMRI